MTHNDRHEKRVLFIIVNNRRGVALFILVTPHYHALGVGRISSRFPLRMHPVRGNRDDSPGLGSAALLTWHPASARCCRFKARTHANTSRSRQGGEQICPRAIARYRRPSPGAKTNRFSELISWDSADPDAHRPPNC